MWEDSSVVRTTGAFSRVGPKLQNKTCERDYSNQRQVTEFHKEMELPEIDQSVSLSWEDGSSCRFEIVGDFPLIVNWLNGLALEGKHRMATDIAMGNAKKRHKHHQLLSFLLL